MRFICFAYEEERLFHEMPTETWQVLRQETLDYVDELQAEGRLISALPLKGPGAARTVRVRDGKRLVTDGPFAETREQIGGFFLIEAAGMDEALDVAARWPSARLGTIEVRPVEDGLDPDRRYE